MNGSRLKLSLKEILVYMTKSLEENARASEEAIRRATDNLETSAQPTLPDQPASTPAAGGNPQTTGSERTMKNQLPLMEEARKAIEAKKKKLEEMTPPWAVSPCSGCCPKGHEPNIESNF